MPLVFVVSGMQLDVAAVFAGSDGVAKLFVFFQSTELPLVLAITTLAQQAGEMRSSTAAALVCPAVFSTLVYPIIG